MILTILLMRQFMRPLLDAKIEMSDASECVEHSMGIKESFEMGAIAEGIVAYAKPLIDETDGSIEQLKKAMAMSQLCFNLALASEDTRGRAMSKLQKSLEMDDEEFDVIREKVIAPMVRRHLEMFPQLHGRNSKISTPTGPSWQEEPSTEARTEAYPGTDRYAPCPCQSGKKYKFCCGKSR